MEREVTRHSFNNFNQTEHIDMDPFGQNVLIFKVDPLLSSSPDIADTR